MKRWRRAMPETLYEIARGLNTARDEDELLRVVGWPAMEAGALRVDLVYFDLDEASEPEWAEIVAVWQREGISPTPPGTRYYLPEFPFSRLFLASQDEPQLVADVTADERVDEKSRNILVQAGLRAIAIIPLAQARRWVGVIFPGWDSPHEFSEQEVEIYRALIGLASPAVENRRLLDRTQKALREVITFKTLAENSTDGIVIGDMEGKITYANRAFCQLFGYDYATGEVIGLSPTNFMAEEGVARFAEVLPQVLSGEGCSGEGQVKRKDGSTFFAIVTFFALRDESGNPIGTAATFRDITERKRAEAERERMQQEIIETQRRALRELSTPIVPVLEGVLVLPLVGSIDTGRAQQIMETLLEAISRHQAEVVIIDITGVPVVDTRVADHLIQVTRAAKLLGARCVLVGISPEVAQTIVSLGVDLSGITTRSNLQSGIEYALSQMGKEIADQKEK